jgi:hypothetical protein
MAQQRGRSRNIEQVHLNFFSSQSSIPYRSGGGLQMAPVKSCSLFANLSSGMFRQQNGK